MTDQPKQDAIVSQRDREVLEAIDDALGFLMDDERAILLDAFATYRAEIKAATIERCAGGLLEKADAFIGMSLHCRHRGPAETLRNKAQLLREQATAIRNLKGQTS